MKELVKNKIEINKYRYKLKEIKKKILFIFH